MSRVAAGLAVAAMLASTLAVTPSAARPVAAAAAGPVAEWTFDEASGTTVNDAAGHLNGTLSGGVSRVTGDVPQGTGALSFDGVDDLLTVVNGAALEPAEFTLTFWMQSTQSDPGVAIVTKGSADCWFSSYGVVSNGGLHGQLLSATGGQQYVYPEIGGVSPYDGKWHLISLSFSGTGGPYAVIGIDGRTAGGYNSYLADGIQYSGGTLSSRNLFIGGPAACEGPIHYQGKLDDVRLYDRALTSDELWAMLPSFSTTTTAWADPASSLAGSSVSLLAKVDPVPPGGQVIFTYTRDGGTPQQINAQVGADGGASWYIYNGQHLPAGHYTLTASFLGAGPAGASTSADAEFTVNPVPVAATLTASPGTIVPDTDFRLSSTVVYTGPGWTGGPNGQVTLYETTSGSEVEVATASLSWSYPYLVPNADFTVPGVAAGIHTYRVRYPGTDTVGTASADLSVTVAKASTASYLVGPSAPIQQHHAVDLQASVYGASLNTAAGPTPVPTGTVAIRDTGTAQIVASGESTATLSWSASDLALGTHQFRAEYGGDGVFNASQSDPFAVTIVLDTVDATGVGAAYSTFYPYKDGYRDTVAVRGTRLEPSSVAIRVYSPTNHVVKSASVAMGDGAYSVAWNGRTSSGTVLAAGKYRVVQTLTDAAGTRRVVTSYVTLSTKRLVTTTKTLTKDYAHRSAQGANSVAWSFTLPAAITYKKLVFSVYASSLPTGGLGAQDFRACARATLDLGCANPAAPIGRSLQWWKVTGSTTYNRSGTFVRLYAVAATRSKLKYGRVTVTYTILK